MISHMRKGAVAFALGSIFMAAASFVYARAQPGSKAVPPFVLSGTDIGFRVEGRKRTSVTGQFVVKIGGQWVDVEESSFGPKLLTTVR
jgi:hypothetical protein